MTEPDETPPQATTNPLGDLLRALAVSLPPSAQEPSAKVLEGVSATAHLVFDSLVNLNQAAKRLNALLDDLEEPIRLVLPHVSTAATTLTKLNEAATTLNELAKRLGPIAAFLPASKPQTGQANDLQAD
jgi:ABC-type transporter Mla subunit MlaD